MWRHRINTGETLTSSPGWLLLDRFCGASCQQNRLGASDVHHASAASDPTSLLIDCNDTSYDNKQLSQLLQLPQTFWLRFNSAEPRLRDQDELARTHYVLVQDFPSNLWKRGSLSFFLTPPTPPTQPFAHIPTQTAAVLLAKTDARAEAPNVMLAVAWDWTSENVQVENVRLNAQPIDEDHNCDLTELAVEAMRTAV